MGISSSVSRFISKLYFIYLGICTFFMPVGPSVFAISSQTKLSSEISGIDLVKGIQTTLQIGQSTKTTVVVFLSAKCPCSNSHLPILNQIAQEYRASGVSFVGVHSNTNEDYQSSRVYFQNSKLSFPVIHDPQAKIADEYAAYKTPHVFVIDAERKVLFQGGVDNRKIAKDATEHYLRDALTAIRDGKKPIKNEVRVVGCVIRSS